MGAEMAEVTEHRLWQILPVQLAMFFDGSFLFAAYAMDSWGDEVDPEETLLLIEAATEAMPAWHKLTGSRNLMFDVQIRDGRIFEMMVGRDSSHTGHEEYH